MGFIICVFFEVWDQHILFFSNFVVLRIWQFFPLFGHFSRIYTKKTTNFKFSKCFFNHSAKICQKQFHWFLQSFGNHPPGDVALAID
jgi:hypothetical protein